MRLRDFNQGEKQLSDPKKVSKHDKPFRTVNRNYVYFAVRFGYTIPVLCSIVVVFIDGVDSVPIKVSQILGVSFLCQSAVQQSESE